MIGVATNDPDEMRRASDVAMAQIAKQKRRKKFLVGLWLATFPVELYFVTRYMTWEEFWRMGGYGMAAGLGFTTALLGLIEVVKWWSMRKIRRLMKERPPTPLGVDDLGAYVQAGEVGPPEPNTWGCLDCGMRGIGPASSHVCPAGGSAEQRARTAPRALLERKCARCGELVEFDAVCPCSRPAA